MSYEGSTSTEQHFHPAVDLIAAETGKEVQSENATDYVGLIKGGRAGIVQTPWTTPPPPRWPQTPEPESR